MLPPDDARRDPVALLKLLSSRSVDRLFLPYVALQQLAEAARLHPSVPLELCEIVTAGETLQVTPAIIALLQRLPNATLYNQYGPTETHVVTEHVLTGDPRSFSPLPPVGKPVAAAAVYLLDSHLRAVPPGVAGEIYVGGLAPARGYLARPDLTAERFLPDPFGKPGSRMYRTGDRARRLADGAVQFLGRVDRQVKIRGFRVEPEEIETVLRRHPSVGDTAIVIVKDAGGSARLAAFVVASGACDARDLRAHLLARLPEHMVPWAIEVVPSLPLTPTGKVDRRALAVHSVMAPQARATHIAPRTGVEESLARIWSAVLSAPRVGVEDNFFELGGHSLLAVQVVARIAEEFGMEVPLRQIFEAPTIGALALAIVQQQLGAHGQKEASDLLAEIERLSTDQAQAMIDGLA